MKKILKRIVAQTFEVFVDDVYLGEVFRTYDSINNSNWFWVHTYDVKTPHETRDEAVDALILKSHKGPFNTEEK
jgi:hypothetical protein